MMYTRICSLILIFTFLYACRPAAPEVLYEIEKSLVVDSAAVVSPHPLSSQIGVEILHKGGNAIDAAVAVQFALAVVYPRAGNLGGGGFMVFRLINGETAALDYREEAPAAASRNMYLDSLGNIIDSMSTYGHKAVGVPGTVAGLQAAHSRYGKLSWQEVIAPAIRLAQNGFRLTEAEAARFNSYGPIFKRFSTQPNAFVKEDEWKTGELFLQPELAKTLERIRDNGSAGFYEGETADKIVAEMQRGGGYITHQDLKNYEAKWRMPIEGNYKGYRIISMPPASSGGIAVVQLMKMMENYPLADYGFHSAAAVHLMVEAERRVYADRAIHLGDSDFYNVPSEMLLDKEYLQQRMADFDPNRATPSDSIEAGNFKVRMESFETTHTSVVDAEGNAVAVTTTLNSNFGSKVVVGGAGFFLNNEMDDFSSKVGVPNQFGLIGAEANAIEPGKRMLSSMTPTIVEKNGRLFLVLGAPGGSTIITAVFQVMANVMIFDKTLDEAVNAGRFHHQWLPDEIWVEEGTLSDSTRQALEAMGHKLKDVDRMAIIKAIHVLPDGRLHGVGDPRNPDDDVEGY